MGDPRFDMGSDDGITVDGNEVIDTELHPTNNQADDQHEMGLSDEFKKPDDEGDIEVVDSQAEVKEQLEAEASEEEPEEKPEAEDPTSADTRQEAKKKRTEEKLQKRMDRLTRKIGDLERENLELRQQSASSETLEEPSPADFDNFDDFEVAHKAWQEAEAEPGEAPMTEADLRFNNARQNILEDAQDWDDCPDDWELIVTNDNLPFDDRLIMAISDTENPAAVMYHLGQNPSEITRLTRMNMDANLVKALDRIESELAEPAETTEPEPSQTQKRTATKADTPIEPLGGGTPPKQVDLDKASFADFDREMDRLEKGQDRRFW